MSPIPPPLPPPDLIAQELLRGELLSMKEKQKQQEQAILALKRKVTHLLLLILHGPLEQNDQLLTVQSQLSKMIPRELQTVRDPIFISVSHSYPFPLDQQQKSMNDEMLPLGNPRVAEVVCGCVLIPHFVARRRRGMKMCHPKRWPLLYLDLLSSLTNKRPIRSRRFDLLPCSLNSFSAPSPPPPPPLPIC
jgi:hypothetical protein